MTFPTDLQTLADEGRLGVRSGVRMALGTGIYGFWNGKGDLVHSELTYWANSLITVSDLVYGLGTAAASFTIEMVAKQEITPDRLAGIESEDYKGRPLTIYDFYFHPDTGGLLHAEPMAYGYIDTVDHVTEGGESKLVGNILSGAIDNHRDGYRSASHEDQQLVSPGDKFYEHASTVKNEYFDIKLD